jgi:starch-binding outer membrane protein, SusD/RagB family
MKAIRQIVAGAAVVTLPACETSVTNPGPVPDDFLNRPEAWPAMVTGARRALANAYGSDGQAGGQLLYWGAAVSFEINPAGSTGSFGIPPQVQLGQLNPQDTEDDWASSNHARFVPEDAIRRFNAIGGAPAQLLAEAFVYAGFANRTLGENFCESVLPTATGAPGSAGPHWAYFQRADSHFTNAIATAAGVPVDSIKTRIIRSATGGRASVRASLASWGVSPYTWAEAVADAQTIPDGFVFWLPYFDQSQDQFNYLFHASANSPYRAHTQWYTFYESYFLTTSDPRTPWRRPVAPEDTVGDALVDRFKDYLPDPSKPQVPWWPQTKYNRKDAPVRLTSGWEMRLIEAEAALVGGNVGPADSLMNIRRTALGLPAIASASLVDAWGALKQERQVELWLEARRLGDLRRWIERGVPGAYRDGVYVDTNGDGVSDTRAEDMTAPRMRALCFAVGQNEADTNPNYP